jgi:hypothetical protein
MHEEEGAQVLDGEEQMTEEMENRIKSLEGDVHELKLATKVEQTSVFGVAMFVALILYIGLISKLPLPEDTASWPRVGIGFASAIGGGMVFSWASAFVQRFLKVIVEVAAVALLLINVSVGALLWTAFPEISRWGSPKGDGPFGGIVLMGAIFLFLFDVLAFLVLYPLARTVGTNIDLD